MLTVTIQTVERFNERRPAYITWKDEVTGTHRMLGDPTLAGMDDSRDLSALEFQIFAPMEPADAFISVQSNILFPAFARHSRLGDLRSRSESRVEVRWRARELRRRSSPGEKSSDELDFSFYAHKDIPDDGAISRNRRHMQNLKHPRFVCVEFGVQSSDLSSDGIHTLSDVEPRTRPTLNALKSLADRRTIRARAYFMTAYKREWSHCIPFITGRLSDTSLFLAKFTADNLYDSRRLAFLKLPDKEFLELGYNVPASFRFDDMTAYLIHQCQAINLEFAAIEAQCQKATIPSAKLWLVPEPRSINKAGIPLECWAIVVHPDPRHIVQFLAEGSSCILAVTAIAALNPDDNEHWMVTTITKPEELHSATVVAPISFSEHKGIPKEWSKCMVKSVAQLTDVKPAKVHVRPPNSKVPSNQVFDGLHSIDDEVLSAAARDFRRILVGRKLNFESYCNWFDGHNWTKDELQKVKKDLEGDQLRFMQNLKRIPGSLAVLKGATGTGKTNVIQGVIRSALVMKKKVAVGASLNKATNRLATTCEKEGAVVCRWASMERSINRLKQIGTGKALEYQRQFPGIKVYKVFDDADNEQFNNGNQLVRDRVFQAQDNMALLCQLARAYLDELNVEFGSTAHDQILVRPLLKLGVQTKAQREREERQEKEEQEEEASRRSVRDRLRAIFDEFTPHGADFVEDPQRVSKVICSAFNIRIVSARHPATTEEVLDPKQLDPSQAEYCLLADMRTRAHESMVDSRVEEMLLEQQPERLALKSLGLFRNWNLPTDLPPTTSTAVKDFVHHWRKVTTQGFVDAGKDERRRFEKAAEKIIIAAVLQVDVVVGILGNFVDCPWLQSVVDLSIADEAGRALEAEVVAFFATFIHKPKILTGDDLLIQPTVITLARAANAENVDVKNDFDELVSGSDVLNPLAAQLQVSILRRISVYIPYTSLNVQYRAVPQISALYQDVIYRSLFTNHPSTAVATRPEAQKFQDILKEHWGLANKSVLLLDVSAAAAEYEPCTLSKVNHGFVNQGLKVLEILEGAGFHKVLGLTPYQGQKRLYDKALDDDDATTIWLTIDNSHGVESDIVVLDLTVTASDKKLTSFVRRWTRLNQALSRARNGLIIIGSRSVGMLNRLPTRKVDVKNFYDYLFTYARENGFLVRVRADQTSERH